MSDLLSKLPDYEPRADLWDRIEADLDTDERLTQLVGELPRYEPEGDLWTRIEGALEQSGQAPDGVRVLPHPARTQPFTRQITWGRWLGAGAAAACLLLVGTYLFRYRAALPSERMEYAVEQPANWVPPAPDPAVNDAADQRAEAFIEQQCAEAALACQRPEVRELRTQLGELTQEQQRLRAERQRFGDDPALVRAQVKLENQRADITKELITLLRS